MIDDLSNYWFDEYLNYKARAEKAEAVLKSLLPTTDILRAGHVVDMGKKIRRLRGTVRSMQRKAEEFNREMYATGLIIHCTGCEAGGPANPEGLTEERVKEIERIAQRMRTWWNNHSSRKRRENAKAQPL